LRRYGTGVQDASWGGAWAQSLAQSRTNGAMSKHVTVKCVVVPFGP
jgi:hypothetical protein